MARLIRLLEEWGGFTGTVPYPQLVDSLILNDPLTDGSGNILTPQ